jgi:hypothetical protein
MYNIYHLFNLNQIYMSQKLTSELSQLISNVIHTSKSRSGQYLIF